MNLNETWKELKPGIGPDSIDSDSETSLFYQTIPLDFEVFLALSKRRLEKMREDLNGIIKNQIENG